MITFATAMGLELGYDGGRDGNCFGALTTSDLMPTAIAGLRYLVCAFKQGTAAVQL
jgi:hypothetical protein